MPANGELPERHVRKGDGRPETMPVHRAFRASQHQPLPHGWAIPAPTPEVVERLRLHGIRFTVQTAVERLSAARFAVDKKTKRKRPYQGHQELELTGTWEAAAEIELPVGTLRIPAAQPLARVAAVLLEPCSEDSLSTWNFFEAATTTHYPVLRVQAR